MLNALSDTASNFHAKDLRVGDIRPENIFVNDDGQLKVATQHSWPNEVSSYERYNFYHEPTLLAPEEMNDVQLNR